ncbi:hypothetical protein SPRG_02698 [Saprolegnia parasitica CBS 223.65]|uniref:Uncharacterized protein n=1 Tax=Saprolegnia parasitica (strain CBS 223.65) TaxID=695850 RepID=A0A067CSL7_SAPPC|nr:hypothetical protein SPRG_02698 [Saprolegnia parasitica CBS 223.65]KDO32220.1 hypothetical protein SPRG_02698 [Saprolegnia parasitica CBS 223.65]|eukprot:XP_012196678.1 hypothetical protein SPRG_02698 [Saprolegnia parasitica CBS 223.65]
MATYKVLPTTTAPPPKAHRGNADRFHSFAFGYVHAILLCLQVPVYNTYLRMEGYQTTAYATLITLPMLLSPTSHTPQHVLLGWSLSAVCLGLMVVEPFPAPYCDVRFVLCPRGLTQAADERWPHYNSDAPASAAVYVLLSALVVLGAVIGSAPRPTCVYRHLGAVVAYGHSALALNGPAFGGSFALSMAPNAAYLLCLGPALAAIATAGATTPREATSSTWDLLQRRSVWQLCVFEFVFGASSRFESTALAPIAVAWAHVEPLSDALARLVATVLAMCIAHLLGAHARISDWRRILVGGSIVAVLLDATTVFRTIWHGRRDQWAFAGARLASAVPIGLELAVTQWVSSDDTTSVLLSSASIVGSAAASSLARILDTHIFAPSQLAVGRDDAIVRRNVSLSFAASYAIRLFGLLSLGLLPANANALRSLQALDSLDGTSKRPAVMLACGLAFVAIVSATHSGLAILPATAS